MINLGLNGEFSSGKNLDLMYKNCRLCPRECGADRQNGVPGRCRMGSRIKAARAALHMWEEPCISGCEGSGAVFFSGCSLRCVFCQNQSISLGGAGKEIGTGRLAEIFLELQDQGANNINLVTAVHFLPSVIRALDQAKAGGLTIPVVYNSGGYEKAEIIRELKGYIDIYLPDFKYMDPELSNRYSRCPDYAQAAKAALAEMVRQAGTPEFDEKGRMRRGVIVRHMLLPGCRRDSKAVIRYLFETYGNQIYISILRQYTPMPGVSEKFPELGEPVSDEEYRKIVTFARRLGVEQGFVQDEGAAGESCIPLFNNEGIDRK